jgi:GMP synthase (glutamine-hydrolysing)
VTGRALVIQHEAICPPGRLGQWLSDAGLHLDVIRPYEGEPVPDALEHDALIVLGGTQGANDDEAWPWLPATRRLLAAAVASRAPTLGICLGHQLLALATGGRVDPNPRGSTTGLRAVDLTSGEDGASDDPLVGDLSVGAVAIHWNDDVVTTSPPGAVILARTPDGAPQVIRVGSRAWGVQFHPEADLGIVTVWADRTVEAGEMSQHDADARLADIARADGELITTWRCWAERFAGVVLS